MDAPTTTALTTDLTVIGSNSSQYTLDSIPTTRTTFITDNEKERNEAIILQAVCLFKDVNIIIYYLILEND